MTNDTFEGIGWDPENSENPKTVDKDDTVFFNFKKDFPEDIVYLTPQKYNSHLSNFRGFNIYYAYRFEFTKNRKEPVEKSAPDMSFGDVVNMTRTILKYGRPPHEKWDEFPTEHLDRMIEISLDRFEKLKSLKEFGSVISLPSKSDLNERIMKQIKRRVNRNTKVISAPFVKSIYKNLKYYTDMFNAMTPKGKEFLISVFKSLKTKTGEVEIKHIPASLRKYIYGFLELKVPLQRIKNYNVLLVDDTIGSGGTFKEAERLIRQFTPNEVWLYAFLKDY